MDAIERNLSIRLRPSEREGAFVAEAGLRDPYHEISVYLHVREEDMIVVATDGFMGWIPYPETCPNALPALNGLVGMEVGAGMTRRIGKELGGEQGCPYVAQLALEAARLAFLGRQSMRAKRIVLEDQDMDQFRALRRNEMGQCAGHHNVGEDQLPQWLECLRREQAAGQST